jgi:PI-3-kinase-related kinase SMG-1
MLSTNELCIVFFKVKSTSGNFHNIVLAIKGCACETNVALSTFSCISHSHTCLTLKFGIILKKTLAITNDLYGVYLLGKEAVTLHYFLNEDLSKANAILLLLESLLSKDVIAITNARREINMEVSLIQGQATH